MKEQLLDTDKEGVTCPFSQLDLEIHLIPSQLSGARSFPMSNNRTERNKCRLLSLDNVSPVSRILSRA